MNLNPSSFQVEYDRGRAAEAEGEWKLAMDAYLAAVAHDPDHMEARLRLGAVAAHRRRWKTVDLAGRVDTEQDAHHYAYLRGLAAGRMALWAEASRHYRTGVAMDADHERWLGGARAADAVDVTPLLTKRLSRPEAEALIVAARQDGAGLPPGWWLVAFERLFRLGWPTLSYEAKRIAARILTGRFEAGLWGRSDLDRVEVAKAYFALEQFDKSLAVLEAEPLGEDGRPSARMVQGEHAAFLRYLKVITDDSPDAAFSDVQSVAKIGDEKFGQLVRGRSIAIVGPANTDGRHGAEIDTLDVIVRTNFLGSDRIRPHADRLGTRTDLVYFNSPFYRSQTPAILAMISSEKPAPFVVFRLGISMDIRRKVRKFTTLRFPKHIPTFYGSELPMIGIPRLIWDSGYYGPKSIKIYNADFYAGDSHYIEGYQIRNVDQLNDLATHDVAQNFIFTREMFSRGHLQGDETFSSIMKWSTDEYLERLERAIAPVPNE